jgi:hypothetical protein
MKVPAHLAVIAGAPASNVPLDEAMIQSGTNQHDRLDSSWQPCQDITKIIFVAL